MATIGVVAGLGLGTAIGMVFGNPLASNAQTTSTTVATTASAAATNVFTPNTDPAHEAAETPNTRPMKLPASSKAAGDIPTPTPLTRPRRALHERRRKQRTTPVLLQPLRSNFDATWWGPRSDADPTTSSQNRQATVFRDPSAS